MDDYVEFVEVCMTTIANIRTAKYKNFCSLMFNLINRTNEMETYENILKHVTKTDEQKKIYDKCINFLSTIKNLLDLIELETINMRDKLPENIINYINTMELSAEFAAIMDTNL
jgi:hypothetical protein